jgi:hypothetical protein
MEERLVPPSSSTFSILRRFGAATSDPMKISTLGAFVLSVSMLSADPLKLDKLVIGSKEYVAVTVEKESELSAKLIHESGVAHVKMTDLPEEVRIKIGFNQDAARAESKRQQDAELSRQQELTVWAKAVRFHGVVLEMNRDGVLAENESKYAPTKPFIVREQIIARSDGSVVRIPASIEQPDPANAGRPAVGIEATVFLVGHPKSASLTYRQRVDIDAVEDGTYTVNGTRYRKFKVLKDYVRK